MSKLLIPNHHKNTNSIIFEVINTTEFVYASTQCIQALKQHSSRYVSLFKS